MSAKEGTMSRYGRSLDFASTSSLYALLSTTRFSVCTEVSVLIWTTLRWLISSIGHKMSQIQACFVTCSGRILRLTFKDGETTIGVWAMCLEQMSSKNLTRDITSIWFVGPIKWSKRGMSSWQIEAWSPYSLRQITAESSITMLESSMLTRPCAAHLIS